MALLQYYFDGEVVPVSVQPHGSKKHDNEPYERTKASVISRMKNKLQEMPPKKVINAMCKEVGGALNVQCSGDEPRNRSQLYNLNRTVEGKSGRKGAHKVTDFNNIMKMSTQRTFVHDFELKGGNPHCFLANQQQLRDVKNFCGSATKCYILGFDPTFTLGQFYVTFTTFRCSVFVNKATGQHLLVPRPGMIQTSRETADNEYLARKIRQHSGVKRIKAWSTDGEAPLVEGLRTEPAFQMPSIHLRCEGHLLENTKKKLTSLGVKSVNRSTILQSIYGTQKESEGRRIRFGGLVDCLSEEDFDATLAVLESEWNSLEIEDTGEGSAKFSVWFKKYQSQVLKNDCLASVRTAAGLGNPPKRFWNNNNEAWNSVFKRDFDWEEQTWTH